MMKFTSEVVPPAARPLVIEYPVGSKVWRLLRTYDDEEVTSEPINVPPI
jgi:hypothetical protein